MIDKFYNMCFPKSIIIFSDSNIYVHKHYKNLEIYIQFFLLNYMSNSAQILTLWFNAVVINIAHFNDTRLPNVAVASHISNVFPFSQIVTAFTRWFPKEYFSTTFMHYFLFVAVCCNTLCYTV